MIKNIFLSIATYHVAVPVWQYCRKYKKYLEEHGFWHPTPDSTSIADSSTHSWKELMPPHMFSLAWQNSYGLPSTQETLKAISHTLSNKPDYHTLLLFSAIPDNEQSEQDYHLLIKHIKKEFPKSTLHILWQYTSLDVAVEIDHISTTIWGIQYRLDQSLKYLAELDDPLWTQCRTQHQIRWGKELPIKFIPCNICDALSNWQQWVALPQPYPAFRFTNLIFSPKTLAFIIAVQPLIDWQTLGTKKFSQQKQPYNWLAEEEFLNFQSDIPPNRQYIREHWKKKINANYAEKADIPWVLLNKEPQAKLSEVPITLTVEDAQILSSLLTPNFRKCLAKDINEATLQYKTHDTRAVFASLLLAENMISKERFKNLTSLPQGICLPFPETTRIEVCTAPPTVAVLTMTYNQRDFIEENIVSVMAQETAFPVIHIIADDASTDGTQEIIKEYATRYPHIHLLINEKNDTPSSIVNLFNQARTPYVALCDGDDYFTDPQKLQSQVDLLEANPSYGLCFHPVALLYEEDPTIMRIYPPLNELPRGVQPYYHLLELVRSNFIQANSAMYRWRFKEGLPLWFNPHLCPADQYWHLLHAECGKIGFQNKIMSVYRRHKKSLFYQTEVDTTGHRKKYAFFEMELYEHLDLHFEGRFTSQFYNLGLNIFSELAIDASKTKDSTVLFNFIEKFPIFKKYIKKTKKF